jgi:hypothetical protein
VVRGPQATTAVLSSGYATERACLLADPAHQ